MHLLMMRMLWDDVSVFDFDLCLLVTNLSGAFVGNPWWPPAPAGNSHCAALGAHHGEETATSIWVTVLFQVSASG
jgi:hypothetical protein